MWWSSMANDSKKAPCRRRRASGRAEPAESGPIGARAAAGMFDVCYFSPNTPLVNIKVGVSLRVLHENT